jgi:hypothetical protein
MRNLFLGAMTIALTGLASPLVNPAAAANFPFCAMGTSTCSDACDFATLEQCRTFILASKGYCAPNPRTSTANALNFSPRPRR